MALERFVIKGPKGQASYRDEKKKPLKSTTVQMRKGFPGVSVLKNLPANAGDVGLIPGSGRSPGVGNGNPLQYSCLENPMGRGAW